MVFSGRAAPDAVFLAALALLAVDLQILSPSKTSFDRASRWDIRCR
jgi:hypothetical protein